MNAMAESHNDESLPPEETLPPPGAALAQRRAAQGFKLEDVARRLKFGSRQIEALEADDYERLPGMTFVRGMIRSYAKLLEMDAAPLVKSLEARHRPAPQSVELASERIPFPDGRHRSTRVYLALSAVLLVAVGAVLYERYFGIPATLRFAAAPAAHEAAPAPPKAAPVSSEPRAAPLRVPPAMEPQPAAPVAAQTAPEAETAPQPQQPAATGGEAIVFEFNDQSWVQVSDGSGHVLLQQLNPGGTRKSVSGEPPFALVIGNATHVRLIYKNAPVDLGPYIKMDVARLNLP